MDGETPAAGALDYHPLPDVAKSAAIGRFIEDELERHGTEFTGQGWPEKDAAMAFHRDLNEIFRDAVRGNARSAD